MTAGIERLAAQVERLLEAHRDEAEARAVAETAASRLRERLEQALARERRLQGDVAELQARLAALPAPEDLEEARQRLRRLLEAQAQDIDPSPGRGDR